MKQPKVNFYNLAWRWHFYAGLFVAPFMVMLALTGTIYLFKPQLDSLMYSSLLNVPAGHHTVPADDLLNRVKGAYPQGTIKQYLPPVNAERSAQFVVLDLIGSLFRFDVIRNFELYRKHLLTFCFLQFSDRYQFHLYWFGLVEIEAKLCI